MRAATVQTSKPPRTQKGVALVIAMVALIGITVLSLASIKTGLLELLMASNEESRMNAFQQAANGLDAVTSEGSNFTLVGGIGYTNCTAGHSDAGACNAFNVTLPESFDPTNKEMKVTRIEPNDACPPRGMKTSCQNYSTSSFAVKSNYDAVQQRLGRSVQNQGYLVLIPRIERGRY